ncbi:MAG: FAD-dependent oxidoreductase, partial [Deltaproteobacteria bacterium]
MGEKRDIVVVGSGFAGAVVAEMCASLLGRRVLLLERRPRLGGNAADALHESGFLVHLHGPHIFHTDDEKVFRYLSRFTEWRPYEHRVMTVVDGKLLPFPINLDTINNLYGLSLTEEECRDFLEEAREEKGNPTNLEEHLLSLVGKDL